MAELDAETRQATAPLTGHLRSVRWSLEMPTGKVEKGSRVGIEALSRACGVTGSVIDSEDVSFRFAPRLNAAGRMHHGEIALKLLTTNNMDVAERLAKDLCRMNQNRQIIEKEIM